LRFVVQLADSRDLGIKKLAEGDVSVDGQAANANSTVKPTIGSVNLLASTSPKHRALGWSLTKRYVAE
jgi:hypothetical protein